MPASRFRPASPAPTAFDSKAAVARRSSASPTCTHSRGAYFSSHAPGSAGFLASVMGSVTLSTSPAQSPDASVARGLLAPVEAQDHRLPLVDRRHAHGALPHTDEALQHLACVVGAQIHPLVIVDEQKLALVLEVGVF